MLGLQDLLLVASDLRLEERQTCRESPDLKNDISEIDTQGVEPGLSRIVNITSNWGIPTICSNDSLNNIIPSKKSQKSIKPSFFDGYRNKRSRKRAIYFNSKARQLKLFSPITFIPLQPSSPYQQQQSNEIHIKDEIFHLEEIDSPNKLKSQSTLTSSSSENDEMDGSYVLEEVVNMSDIEIMLNQTSRHHMESIQEEVPNKFLLYPFISGPLHSIDSDHQGI